MRVLVVDDEPKICFLLKGTLEDENTSVDTTSSPTEALTLAEKFQYDIILTDLRMAPFDGIEFIRRLRGKEITTPVIVMTAYASVQTAVEAMKKGAYDYIIKPFDIEELKLLISRAVKEKRLERENKLLKQRVLSEDKIIGESAAIRRVLSDIEKVAPTDASVLVIGESGVGKELVAKRIHNLSHRRDGPFVPINCAAITETLLESELFGYEKGAFTGANSRKIGYLEAANGGTVFLDEIGDIPPTVQVKLLRIIQEKKLVRVGGITPIDIDVRFISATNKNLEKLIDEGSFREDLYFRIAVFPIRVPPLRERREDIPLLIKHFLSQRGESEDKLSPEVMKKLVSYHWRGNIRELMNVLERALILSGDGKITLEHIPEDIRENKSKGILPLSLEDIEKKHILEVLEKTNGNKSEAARLLGITRRRLYSIMERLGIGKEK
ncbi:sigma-54-dependent Fis family transcriptional regulator [bacterium]|nr:sigma-54-dependent Fis family transcriptional regulator [bacterium]